MNKDMLFEHYEKLYFHELETREKITTRIQFTFALLASAFTLMSYMVRMLNHNAAPIVVYAFLGLSAIFLFFFVSCLKSLVPAYWGNLYQLIPTPESTDRYKDEVKAHNEKLEKYNSDYPENAQETTEPETKVKGYLYESYRNCATHNSLTNEWRSEQSHIAFKRLLYSAIPLILSATLFVANDLDLSSPRVKKEKENTLLLSELAKLKARLGKIENTTHIVNREVKNMPKSTVDNIPAPPPEPSTPEPRDSMEDYK